MRAKIAQFLETKEQKAKNPLKVLLSHIFCVPLPPTTSHWNRLVTQSREFFDRQITAEWGNENCCQFVTQIFLNPPNCLCLQIFCDFIQSYEISERNTKKPPFFFYFRTKSKFGAATVTKWCWLNYCGWLHSNEYRRNALADNVTAQVIRDEKRNLFLQINETPITQWFGEQFGLSFSMLIE